MTTYIPCYYTASVKSTQPLSDGIQAEMVSVVAILFQELLQGGRFTLMGQAPSLYKSRPVARQPHWREGGWVGGRSRVGDCFCP